MTGAACREAEDLLLLGDGDADATTRVRVDRHVSHCNTCQTVRARLEQTRADVRAGAPPLDDVRRAHILARLAPAIDERAAEVAAARRGQPAPRVTAGRLAFALAAVALAVTGTFAWQRDRLFERSRPTTVARSAPIPAAPAAAAPATGPESIGQAPRASTAPEPAAPNAQIAPEPAPPALIEPYRIVTRTGGRPDRSFLQQRFQRLRTAAGTTVRARVGARTRVSLVGPTEVAVLSDVADVLDVEVQSGTFVADFTHRRTGRLRIHSPGAITEVVGTLFAVEVRGTQSRVSVAHGRVVVQPSEGAPLALSAGESWTSGTPDITRLPAPTAALLADHDAARRPATAVAPPLPHPTGSTAVASSAAPVPEAMPDVPPERPVPTLVPSPPATAPAPLPAPPTPPRAVVALATPARPAATAPPPAAIATPETSYRDAETAMRRRDWTAARRALEQVVAGGRNSALEDVARYELAQLAMRTGDEARAARWLDSLLASDREPALRESARFLRCEVRARAGDTADARRCLEAFRASYPASPRDASALGWLIRLGPARAPCATVQPLVDEYLRRHPGGADSALARQRTGQCTP